MEFAEKRLSLKMIFTVLCILLLSTSSIYAKPPTVGTSAQAAALIDVQSGRIIYSHNGHQKMRIASLTKIMTAIVAIEEGNLADKVKVSRNAFGEEGSSIYLKLGEEMNLEHLLYGLMLRSGNDAAVAIAEHVGGSVEGFAYLMNKKAQEIGMANSHFMNPHGLDSEGHYSTAEDMAKLTAYALKNDTFQEIVGTKYKKVPNPFEDWDHVWRNKNKMLSMYEGADGVKTGYTKKAGRCLVSSATRGNQQLAVVTLNDPNDWVDHSNLLDYGFKHYPLKEIMKSGQAIPGQEGLVAGRTLVYPLHESEMSELRYETTSTEPKSVDYRLGDRGTIRFYLKDQLLGTIPLYSQGDPRIEAGTQATNTSSEDDSFKDTLSRLVKTLFTGTIG
ncbi:D-alanyl-D-alanine carboxypeptidase family protein [Marinicrinis lubricantis]|uniref:D-alanyl-D-alanine carboxypeptidase family protein n=1 Tax=Marinicrinis lubricantis TaxID=2086470 RepID=A0ABW1ISP9_9BACL